MKIAIDCRMIQMSGIGSYLRGVLEEILARDFDFLLVGKKEELLQYAGTSVEIIECDIAPFSPGEIFFYPVKAVNSCDVFYSPNFNIPFGITAPVYATIHDIVFLDIPGLVSFPGRLIRKYFLKRALSISETVFTVSRFSKKRIMETFPGYSPVVTYQFVDSGLAEKAQAVAAAPPFIDEEYILCVGNIKKHKNVTFLLDAWQNIRKSGYGKKLVIVGQRENLKSFDPAAAERLESGEGDGIIFTGYLDRDRLYNVIAHAALLVQPSLYEGFGIPPLEALLLGTGVLVSDIEVFREVYGGFPVTFFDPLNMKELENALLDYDYRAKKVELKTELKEMYSFEKTVDVIIKEITGA